MKIRKMTAVISMVTLLVLGSGLWIYKNSESSRELVEKPSTESQNTLSTQKPQADFIEDPQQVIQKKEDVNKTTKPPQDQEQVEKPKQNIVKETDADSEKLGWYYKPNKEHILPEISPKGKALLEKYDGIYHGDINSKTLYLTFDEGYENGYTPQILDVLRSSNVKAAFFITGDYLRRNPELVKRMVSEGHIVGNHTNYHPSLPTLDNETIKKEINNLSDSFQELTGAKMSYLRPPMGEYSGRSLKTTYEMGYRNVFWSVAMVDWQPEAGTPEGNKQTIQERLHSGAVILLHAVNKANAEMLPDLIQECKQEGYQFKTLDDI